MAEQSINKAVPIGIGAAFAVIVALILGFVVLAPGPQGGDDAGVAVQQDPAALDQIASETAPEVAATAPISPDAVATASMPEFDTFRMEPDGSMVVAGRAAPNATVAIVLAGTVLDRVQADGQGNFVAFPMADPAAQPRRLSLIEDPDGAATESSTTFLVAPFEAPAQIATLEPDEDAPASQAEVVADADAPDLQPAEALPEPTPATDGVSDGDAPALAAAPVILQSDADGVTVVQNAPNLQAPAAGSNVALDAITYDPDGEVQLSGRASGDGAVQVYINNEPVVGSEVLEGGGWRLALPQIDTGVYTLRIDEIDTEGAVVSRLETPFKREEASEVAAVMAEDTQAPGFEVAVRTVQPGSTLWAIAEENLGEGIRYVEVFEANRDLIRDPDLIYPGQIFRIPAVGE